jgi:hypothetical protein
MEALVAIWLDEVSAHDGMAVASQPIADVPTDKACGACDANAHG